MGISLGSSSKKPYVGSKEVQEAYVGSQLVYINAKPFNGVFFDSATRFVLEGYTMNPNSKIQDYTQTATHDGGYFIGLSSGATSTIPYIMWSGLDIPAFNTLTISSPERSDYAKNIYVQLTFNDGTNMSPLVTIYKNKPGIININGKIITQMNIRMQNTGSTLISNISLT